MSINNFIINSFKFLFLLSLSSCSNLNFLNRSFVNHLNSNGEKIEIQNIYQEKGESVLVFKFTGNTTIIDSVKYNCQADSIFIINSKKDFFFEIKDNFEMNHLKSSFNPKPFGNMVTKVILKRDTVTINFDNGGPGSISTDAFIYKMKIHKKNGIVNIGFFDGQRMIDFNQ